MKSVIIAFDFETTGFKSQDEEIIEYAFVKYRDGQVIDRISSLVKPSKPVSAKITEITGITNEMLETALPMKDHIKKISAFIGNDALVAHNASFDKKFLNVALYRHGIHLHKNMVYCSMFISMFLLKSERYIKLIDAVKALDLTPISDNFHRAENDAYCAGQIFYVLIIDHRDKLENPNFLEQFCKPLKEKKQSAPYKSR